MSIVKKLGMEPINLDIKQAAQFLGISWRYIDQIKCKKLDPAENKLVGYLKHGKRVLFPLEELKLYNERLQKEQWAENG